MLNRKFKYPTTFFTSVSTWIKSPRVLRSQGPEIQPESLTYLKSNRKKPPQLKQETLPIPLFAYKTLTLQPDAVFVN